LLKSFCVPWLLHSSTTATAHCRRLIKHMCAHFVAVYMTWTLDKCAHMRFTELQQR